MRNLVSCDGRKQRRRRAARVNIARLYLDNGLLSSRDSTMSHFNRSQIIAPCVLLYVLSATSDGDEMQTEQSVTRTNNNENVRVTFAHGIITVLSPFIRFLERCSVEERIKIFHSLVRFNLDIDIWSDETFEKWQIIRCKNKNNRLLKTYRREFCINITY